MKKIKWIVFFTIMLTKSIIAGEGMWLPFLLAKLNEADMKKKGLKISAEDIYSINKGSLKDAIVQFGGGCTATVVSAKGLLFTNHHCGFGQIQSHSTLEHNYLKDGFWAKTMDEELPNEGLTALFVVKMEDVSDRVLKDVVSTMTEKERQSKIDQNISELKKSYKKESDQDLLIRAFYEGNQYILFVTETYKDVRLVGTPPSSIGKFGSDTDNWVWPRHTGDFSIFRIYADKNNRPAAYSKDNVPYKPKHSLPISLDGVAEGDFTMVYGFPGRTQEYLPSIAVEQIANQLNPIRIGIRDKALAVMGDYMRKDEKTNIQYASKYASIANAWKKWIGESMGINRTNGVQKKKNYESEFLSKLSKNADLQKEYGSILTDMDKVYTDFIPYAKVRDRFTQTFSISEILSTSLMLDRMIKNSEKDKEVVWNDKVKKYLKGMEDYFKDYNEVVDREVFRNIIPLAEVTTTSFFDVGKINSVFEKYNKDYNQLTDQIFKESNLTSHSKLSALMSGSREEIIKKLSNDPAYIWTTTVSSEYYTKVDPKLKELQEKINLLQRKYMKAQLSVFTDKKFYPDANSTLRLTYGNVAHYLPKDGVKYEPFTNLDGVMEKYKPGDYEFDVPQKLQDLYAKKDYGMYGENGKMPVCFIASNHTTGGNSGSPAFDAYGNFIGINFDRVWEGTMSDINYDPSICRNIMVDARYILFIIDKFANAGHLVKEMKLVHPKQKKG